MKIRLAVIIAIVNITFLLFSGCKDYSNPAGSNTSSNSTGATNTVVIKSFAFSPAIDTILHGTTVTWKNNDGVAHTSTSNTGVWDTGNISASGTATTTFNTVGTFPYHCTVHPSMTGTMVVK